MLLEWRNSPQVSSMMKRDDPILPEEHFLWMREVLLDKDVSRYRIIMSDETPIGLISLTSIDHRRKSCEWGGYIGEPASTGKKYGKAALYLSLDMAFDAMSLNRVSVVVLQKNTAAIRLYESMGFVREGEIRQYAMHRTGSVDAVSMSILNEEWLHISQAVRCELEELDLLPENLQY